jgi:HD-like signal output (HDOD) protein/ActR/RegA family two-component response regulator
VTPAPHHGALRVLFVDDDARVLASLVRSMRKQGWEIHTAPGGAEALDHLASNPVDVVCSDMRMPEMDGAELLHRIQSHFPGIARIMMSGYAEQHELMRAVEVAHQFVGKPCSARDLQAIIGRARVVRDLVGDPDLHRLVCGLGKLPAPRGVYQRLQGIARRANATIRDFASVIETDAALAAKLLQIANSAFFAPAVRVTSIERAIGHLGLDVVRAIALGEQVVAAIAENLGPGGAELVDSIQRHSLYAVYLGRSILADRPDLAEDAWVAMLLHDVGELILAAVARPQLETARAVARRDGIPTYLAERRVIGRCHATIGAHLLHLWGIPVEVVEAIARHHDLASTSGDGLDLVAAVHVVAGLADEQDGQVSSLDVVELERRGLGPSLAKWRALVTR